MKDHHSKKPSSILRFKVPAIIFVVGSCVSIAFFILSSVFVDLQKKKMQTHRQENVRQILKSDFTKIEESFIREIKSVQLMSSIELRDKNIQRNTYFKDLQWVGAKELSLSNKVSGYSMFLGRSVFINPGLKSVLKASYKTFPKKSLGRVKRLNEYGNAFMLSSLLKLSDGEVGLLLATVDEKKVFQNKSLYKMMGIADVSFSNGKGIDLAYIPNGVTEQLAVFDFPHAGFSEVYKVKVHLLPTGNDVMLRFLPWVVFATFISFTVVYIIIRLSSIKRASEMQALNSVLANRNLALKSEIKKRERMNMAVRQSEQENRAIINAINEVIFELDSDGRLCFINDTWRRVTGYDLSESISETFFDYIEEDHQSLQKAQLQEFVAGRKGAYTEVLRLKAKDGRYKPIEMSLSMVRQDQHKNLRVVGTLTDLEEKELAELAIVAAEENYKRIWKNAANGIYEQDLKGKVISANPAMANILGYEGPDELLKMIVDMTEMVYVYPQEKKDRISEAIKTGVSKKFEIKAYRQDGAEIWLNEFIQPVFDEGGDITHLEGTIDDVTDRKNADMAMRKAKVESDMANRAKSDFIANMSHELRTPLNSIIGFAEIIRDQVMGNISEPAYSEYAGEIHKSGKGLLSIINQILDVSKIESGDREINESLVRLPKVALDTVTLFSEAIKEKQLSVVNNIDDSFSELIAEDRSVRQMFYNIVSNAVKFTPHKGTLTFDAVHKDGGDICVSLQDTGEGLTPEQIDRAMQPFDLMDGEHSREGYGVGLGLTLVKLLMDMHGGGIDIESEKGVGTKISLIFPKERTRTKPKKQANNVLDADPTMIDGADVFDTGTSKSVH